MATLIDTPPDHISREIAFTMFRWGDDMKIGSVITSVYSPVHSKGWRAVRFKVVLSARGIPPAYQPIAERELTPEEIAHFEALMREE